MKLVSALLSALVVLANPAWADPLPIPTHVVRDIRRFVEPSEAIIVGTVTGLPEGGKVALKVDKTLFGQLPEEIELSTAGIYEVDYEVGAQLLLSLRKLKAKNRFAITGFYERVMEGNVREYTLESYLVAVNREFTRLQNQRKSLAAPAPAAAPSTVATSTPATP